MPKKRTILNVSNRLPVTVTDQGIKKSSGGLVAALEGVDPSLYDLRWLGWPGGSIPEEQQPEIAARLKNEFGCVPVFVSDRDAQGHYEGFSNASLWSLLHYMPSKFQYQEWWQDAYRSVNQQFADTVLELAGEEDLVWVHDYQLMLLPRLLKTARPSLRVGFFLHTPFPSYEVFRCHPNREELLDGLLGADLIGFHTFGYLRHFRSAVLRLLGLDSDITVIRHNRGASTLGVYPIGINAPAFEQTMQTDDFAEQVRRFRENFGHKRIVLSVERLDYTKGLPQRLEAIDLFLSQCDEAVRNNIKFIFVSVPSRESVGAYQDLREDVESRIGRLNGKHTTLVNSPIHFIHGTVTFPELCALYALAEVCLVTPLMDGMNLVAKEYVACQAKSPGVLILSEFAGAAQELFSALIVNPYDVQSLADTLKQALAMPEHERRERMIAMSERVRTMDAGTWARRFIEDLAEVPTSAAPAGNAEEALDELVAAVRSGKEVALFLDYDGSLAEIAQTPDDARPTHELLDILQRLTDRPNIRTTIVSGRSAEDLEMFLGIFDRLGFVAEHGARVKMPGESQWTDRTAELDFGWKEHVKKILKMHADSTPGSFVEEKRTSLVWHHRRADPELGEWKARQLVAELSTALANAPLHVRQGKKIVEITPQEINKGAAVASLMARHPTDLAMAAGDDATDESMFRLERPHFLTIKIGEGDTRARYVLPNPGGLRRMLKQLLDRTA